LITSVIAVSAASTAAVSISIFSQIPLMTMNIKTGVSIVLGVGAVSAALVVKEHATVTDLRQQNQTLQAAVQRFESGSNTLGPVDAVEFARLKKDAEEVHQLRAQMAALTDSNVRPGTAAPRSRQGARAIPEIAVNSNIDDWMKIGNDLIREGKKAEALEYYLWCYDEGMKGKPGFGGVRTSFLLLDMQKLAQDYEPARAAMEERRLAMERAVTDSTTADVMSVLELIRLNEYGGDPSKSMALFDQLSATHPARTPLIENSMEQFIRAGRYQDIVSFSNPEASLDQALSTAKTRPDDANYQSYARRKIVKEGGWAIEALSGVGQAERARGVLGKVLKYDSSPETKGELLKYAQRGGNQALIEHLQR
jgi:hypothetical protein